MISKTVRGGYDAWVQVGSTKRRPKSDFLQLQSGQKNTYIRLRNPAPRGAIVVTGTLRFRHRGASTGARTLTVRRVAEKWVAKKIHGDNQPGVTGTWQPTAAIGTVADGDVVDFDVKQHLQTASNGSPHWGWRITTDAATAHRLYGLDASKHRPVLIVEYTWKPDAPTNLTSGGGSLAKPLLQFDFDDLSGKLDLAAIQVQIDPAGNATTPAWDSGEVVTTEPELDLATTTYPGLADLASTQWRARAKSDDGYWSDWSDWVSLSRTAKGALVVTNPAAAPGDIVTDPTPPITWTFTGQRAYRVTITDAADRSIVLHDTGKVAGAGNSYTPPLRDPRTRKKVISTVGGRYAVRVRVWDDKARVANTGDPTYVEVWRDFTFAYDGTQAPANSLTVTQDGELPCAVLRFTRTTNEVQTINLGAATAGTITIGFDGQTTGAVAFNATAAAVQAALEGLSNIDPGDVTVTGGPLPGTVTLTFGGRYAGQNVPQVVVTPTGLTGGAVTVATTTEGGVSAVPDSWSIERNGEIIESDIDPTDLPVEAGQLVYRDWTAPAYTTHTYRAVPVVNGKAAAGGPTATVYLRIRGVWVVHPVNQWRFNLLEADHSFAYGETSEVAEKFTTVARKIASIRGLEGGAKGVLIDSDADPRPLADQLADVFAIKERPLQECRVALVDVNFPAVVGNVDPAPSSEFLEGIEQRTCSFSAWQDGELPFKAQA